MSTPTPEQKEAVVSLAVALLTAIIDAKSIPSGHLYAIVMNKISIETYDALIAQLIKAGMISQSGFVLKPTQDALDARAQGIAKTDQNPVDKSEI